MIEPRYVDDPFGGDDIPTEFSKHRPVWMTPRLELERRALNDLGMQYYPSKEAGGRQMRSQLREVAKSMVSLESGVVGRYPMEWVYAVLAWVAVRARGAKALRGFLNSLEDQEWRNDFVRKWQQEHQTADYLSGPSEPDDVRKYLQLPKE